MILPRTILKQDLAKKLYPQCSNTSSAMQFLRKEIKRSQALRSKLDKLTSNKRAHYYGHKEVEAILEHFCIELEDFKML